MPETEILPNSTVILEGRKCHYEGTTDTNGNIVFTDLAPDTYTLLITHTGHKDYTHPEPIIISPDKLNKIQLNIELEKLEEASQQKRTLNIQLQPPLEDVEIFLANSGGEETSQTTNEEGQATFPDVPYGNYNINLEVEGYEEYSQNITVNRTNNNPRQITINLTHVATPN